ncbi:MAG: NFACT RNA binding domain-containing protein [Planctomycetota bacterium]
MNPAELELLADEIDRAAKGRRVVAVVDRPGGGQLFLLARPGADRPSLRLLVVAEPNRARIHLAPPSRPAGSPPERSGFTRDAKPFLEEATLTSIRAVPGERLVRIEFTRDDPAGAAGVVLVCELFGPRPNLLLIDGGRVIRALKHHRKGRRAARVGAEYQPPDPRPGGAKEEPPRPDLLRAGGAPEGDFESRYPLSARVDREFQPLDEQAEREARTARIRQRLAQAEEAYRKLESRLQQEREEAEGADRQRELGDLLSANFARLRPRTDQIELEDLYRGGTCSIPLNRELSPQANLEAYYRRARKLERKVEAVAERLLQARARGEQLKEIRDRLEKHAASGADPDSELLELLARAGLVSGGEESAGRPTRPATKSRLPPGVHRFVLASGLEALVGKSNLDNDTLTTRIARGNDIWMHVHGFPGSHVVIRLPRGKTASLEDLTSAAALAVHYSKRRGHARCDVAYTPRKYVRKGRRMAPGAVTLERFKVLTLRDPEELFQALLARQP